MSAILKRVPLLLALTTLAGLLALGGCSDSSTDPLTPADGDKAGRRSFLENSRSQRGTVVVANRGSGDISVLDDVTGELLGTFMLPYAEGENMPEPMYVNGRVGLKRVFVGDRANNRVVVFNSRTFEVEATVPTGQGVFHQWIDRNGKQLWVNNDIDNTITVIDPSTLVVVATIDLPADLVAMGGKPHDVVTDHRGRCAYVTMLGFAGENDYLLQYDVRNFTEMNRQPVGKDPHLALGRNTDLYVPAQGSDEVRVFDPESLELIEVIEAPGAHGAAVSPNGRWFYTTNLPGGGADAVQTIETASNMRIGEAVATPYAVPHNLVLSPDNRMLFVTHSGPTADKVTFFRIHRKSGLPTFAGEVTVGSNPFGIGYAY